MYKIRCILLVLFIAAIVVISAPAGATAADNLLSFGFGGGSSFDSKGAVGFAEFERVMSDRIGLAFRAGVLDYEYDDGWYHEEGDGPGVEASVRFYLLDDAPKSLYVGGGLGIWATSWDYVDYNYVPAYRGSGDSVSVEVHAAIGAHFNINDKVIITPAFQLGSFVSSDSELGPYILAGVSVGFHL